MKIRAAIAPGGDILTVNGVDGNIVETTSSGQQVATFTLDNTVVPGEPNGNGTLFGLAVAPGVPACTSSTTARTRSTSSTRGPARP